MEKLKANIFQVVQTVKQTAQEDERRIAYGIKVGIALAVMYLFYYNLGEDIFGTVGMTAVLTVVAVFEFTVGETISKFINRGGATLLASALGLGAVHVTGKLGEEGEHIVLEIFIFLLEKMVTLFCESISICSRSITFIRFIPVVKKRYDHGVTVFTLTFILVVISSSQVGVDKILQIAHRQLLTVLIGGATCIAVSIILCPVWAGQDLHEHIVADIEKLSDFVQGFGDELGNQKGGSHIEGYKTELNSQTTEESLANFAWWEPRHGRFSFSHPWTAYLKIGTLTRECAGQIEAMHALLNTKSPGDQVASEFQLNINMESSKALKLLSASIKNMHADQLLEAQIHLENSKSAANDLTNLLKNSSLKSATTDLHEIVRSITAAQVVINCMEKIFVSVDELFGKTGFAEGKPTSPPDKQQHQRIIDSGVVKPTDSDVVVIEINDALGDTQDSRKVLFEMEITVDGVERCDDRVVVIEISEDLEGFLESKKLQCGIESTDDDDTVPCDVDLVHIIEISN